MGLLLRPRKSPSDSYTGVTMVTNFMVQLTCEILMDYITIRVDMGFLPVVLAWKSRCQNFHLYALWLAPVYGTIIGMIAPEMFSKDCPMRLPDGDFYVSCDRATILSNTGHSFWLIVAVVVTFLVSGLFGCLFSQISAGGVPGRPSAPL